MALDWGTGKKSVTIQPRYFFNVYYAAIDVLTQTKYRKEGIDVTDVFDEYDAMMAFGINYLRDNPLALNDGYPLLQVATLHLDGAYRHPKGKYGQAHHLDTFIPCGVAGCGQCASYKSELMQKTMQEMTNNVSLPVPPPQYCMTLPVEEKESPPSTQDQIVNTLNIYHESIKDGIESIGFSKYIKGLMDDEVVLSDKAMHVSANILTLLNTEQLLQHYKIVNGDE